MLSPFSVQSDSDMVTGSISPARQTPSDLLSLLDTRLDPEDTRRARAAFATALDPQGSGSAVRWDNPDSGARGTVAAVGGPYLQGDTICRNFIASAQVASPETWRQGRACRLSPGEWDIRELKPWQRPR
jgi:surface antigen